MLLACSLYFPLFIKTYWYSKGSNHNIVPFSNFNNQLYYIFHPYCHDGLLPKLLCTIMVTHLWTYICLYIYVQKPLWHNPSQQSLVNPTPGKSHTLEQSPPSGTQVGAGRRLGGRMGTGSRHVVKLTQGNGLLHVRPLQHSLGSEHITCCPRQLLTHLPCSVSNSLQTWPFSQLKMHSRLRIVLKISHSTSSPQQSNPSLVPHRWFSPIHSTWFLKPPNRESILGLWGCILNILGSQ